MGEGEKKMQRERDRFPGFITCRNKTPAGDPCVLISGSLGVAGAIKKRNREGEGLTTKTFDGGAPRESERVTYNLCLMPPKRIEEKGAKMRGRGRKFYRLGREGCMRVRGKDQEIKEAQRTRNQEGSLHEAVSLISATRR